MQNAKWKDDILGSKCIQKIQCRLHCLFVSDGWPWSPIPSLSFLVFHPENGKKVKESQCVGLRMRRPVARLASLPNAQPALFTLVSQA
jgi:hypothetical protein